MLNNVYIVGENGAALGRHSASNDIVISESFVSRRHCEIKYISEESNNTDSSTAKFYMRDIGSTTGSFIMVRTGNKVVITSTTLLSLNTKPLK